MNEEKYDEYQGFDSLYYAEIVKDTDGEGGAYECKEPKPFAPAGEISIGSSVSSTTKYYDNRAYLNITSEGATEVNIVTPILPNRIVADITGKNYDEETGTFLDTGEPVTKYFAILYRLQFTDGTYRYVVRNKGSFTMGEESAKTRDDGTDSTNQSITFKSINTIHTFTKTGKSSKAIIIDERDGKCDLSTFFTTVMTPDNIKAKNNPQV